MYLSKHIARVVTALALIVACCPLRADAQVNTDQVVNVGRNAMYFEDYVVAIQYFNRAIAAKPYLAYPYFYRAIAKYNLEDFKGAEDDAARALEINPYITDAWEVRGVARQNLGNNRGAIADYEQALALLPNNRQIMYNLAAAQTDVADYAAADSIFGVLIDNYPGFENAYLGRARSLLMQNDTVRAVDDIHKALKINADSYNGHIMLSEIAMQQSRDSIPAALAHLEQAIRLQPKIPGLYINRAYLRYVNNDWPGAMDDYDMAITLDPENRMARFNRGLLNMEVSGYDTAVADFTEVLAQSPNDVRALYNRAYALSYKRMFREALADADHIIALMPEYPAGYAMRAEINRRAGNASAASRDYDRSVALAKRLRPAKDDGTTGQKPKNQEDETELSDEDFTKREFSKLLTVDDNTDFREEYNNSAIRGRVQDRNVTVNLEPMVEFTYYPIDGEVSSHTFYTPEVDDINASRGLHFPLYLSTQIAIIADNDITDKHFKSIEYYNSYLANHRPRAIDFIARALDLITVHDYESAVRDLDKAIALTPDFGPAYQMRAQARARMLDAEGSVNVDARTDRAILERAAVNAVIDDLDAALRRMPRSPYLYYNKGNMLMRMGDVEGAIRAYDAAIALNSGFGEAYFNRGYAHLKAGDKNAGVDDLSRAGQLGIVAAYNLIKRISK